MGEIANDMIEGFSCSWCGIYFEGPHGYPVLCKECYHRDLKEARSDGLQKATIKELCES